MKQNFKSQRDELAKKNKHQVKLYKKYHDYLKKNRYQQDDKHRKGDRITGSSKQGTNDNQNSIGGETHSTTVILKFDKDSKENTQ